MIEESKGQGKKNKERTMKNAIDLEQTFPHAIIRLSNDIVVSFSFKRGRWEKAQSHV